MTDTPKRFEDWIEVDCNDCAHWWDNSCDGVKPTLNQSRMPCNSFLATRSIVIPEQIKSLQRANKRVLAIVGIISLMNIGLLISIMSGWIK